MNVRHIVDDERRAMAGPLPVHTLVALARRPSAWLAAATSVRRFAPRGWWRRPPFLPVPDARYWRFRMQTAFGDAEAAPELVDLVTAMHWTRRAGSRQR